MFQNSAVVELKKQYEEGERQFQKIQLRRADLRGLDLSYADLSGSDLSYANLREVNFEGANLSEAYLNEADLTGANLQGANFQGAYLIKAYLIKANLQNTKLNGAYLSGAYLTKGNLTNADLTGAYLNGSKLSGAELKGAYYDHTTHFDVHFDPRKSRMQKDYSHKIAQGQKVVKITLEELLHTYNHLSLISIHYLGPTMTARYWQSAKPEIDWLNHFEVNRFAQIKFLGEQQERLTPEQTKAAQEWFNRFLATCCQIIQDFPEILDPKQIVFPITSWETGKKNLETSLAIAATSVNTLIKVSPQETEVLVQSV